MGRIVRVPIELQPEGNYLGASADMPGIVTHRRSDSEMLDSADTVVINLIAAAGFTFDPLMVLS